MKRFNQNWDGVSRTNLTEATTQTLSKMDYRSATNTDVNGTSRVGRIEGMSVNDLIKVLGKPHRRTPSKPHTFGDGKSTVEWAFKRIGMTNKLGVKFDFVFTVYDYKNPPKDDNTKMVWSVGGKTKMDAYAIQQVLRVAGLKVIREEVESDQSELSEAGTRVSGQALHWWQVINNHCGYTLPMSEMEVQKKTGVKPVFNRAMGKAMTEFVMKVTDGKTGPIIHIVIYQEQDGNTKGWDVAVHSSGQAQSANIPFAKSKMKQLGMPLIGKKPMTSKEIMSGEEVEQGEGETEITEASYFKTIKTMNDLVKDAANGNRVIPKGVSIQKIIGGTQTWRTVKDSDDTKKAVASQAAEIKKIAHLVGNPDDKTIAFIAKIFISQMQHGKKESVEEARTNNTGTPTPVRLGKGRPAGAMSPQALFMHKFDQLENDNAHGAAALLLAKFMGNSKAVKCIELVNKIHETEGSIPHLIQQYRDRWSERLWADFDKKYPNERSV